MLFKKVKVIMLSTIEKSKLVLSYCNELAINWTHDLAKFDDATYQNLYFLSDEEIKVGDWMFHTLDKKPIQWNGEETESNPSVYGYKKIIATTELLTSNINLPVGSFNYLPQPSQSFIEKFVEEYNKGNVITEVMVEYEKKIEVFGGLFATGKERVELKINPKDNTITIRKVNLKGEHIINFVNDFIKEFPEQNLEYLKLRAESWIEENL